ncbi:cache domain-containing sensor histidine kinase [Paenibacillus lutrae]|uniref:histidine kinase n=1 Tax=Paenibacillus lutrae TaxID=2078573 RepID=A0A7X3JZ52_9BACL|nr:histidine kinase [Paenibacillus lutrae]MVO99843.1 sensor histidine kinase [Paenibacillus lutrae]
MKRWLGRSLKRKLSFLMLVSIGIPLLSFGIFSYQMAASVTEEKASQAGMNLLAQMRTNLELMVQDVENMSIFLIGQRDVQQYLSDTQWDALRPTIIIGFLTNLAFSKPYIAEITIHSARDLPELSNTSIVKSGMPDWPGPKDISEGDRPKWWTPLYTNRTTIGEQRVISLVRPVRSTNTFAHLGRMTISLDQNVIAELVRKSAISENGQVFLLDGERKLVAGGNSKLWNSPIKEWMPDLPELEGTSGTFNIGEGKEKRTVLYDTVPGVDWKLVGVMPFEDFRKQNEYVLLLTALAAAIAVVLVSSLVLFFVQKVTEPLLMLTRFLKDTDPEEPMKPLPVTSADEVGQLMRSYNRLSDRIERLTEQVKRNEARKKETDMLALQAQIHPHFLYNTLSSVHWMALMSNDMKIAEMVGHLSDFLRFSLNKGSEFCEVQQEISHAQHYAAIQAVRYPDKFTIDFIVDSEIRQKKVLKLLLQPLIENALIHGIQKQAETGKICVYVQQMGTEITFMVEDTGVGIDPDKVNEIRAALSETADEPVVPGSYGLRNVHRRLQLHYGPEAGLHIRSRVGEGTIITFTIPVIEGAGL